MRSKSVIVVGAGIGGLATAAILAKRGLKVTVVEKNQKPGGRCGRIVREGHVFDTGPTMYLFPELFEQFFEEMGERVEDYLKLLRADPVYRLNFADGSKLVLTKDMEKMETQLNKMEPGSYKKYLEYIELGRRQYDLAINGIARKSLAGWPGYYTLPNLYKVVRSRALENHARVVKGLFRLPNLVAAMTFEDSYLSMNPFRSRAIYGMFAYTGLVHGNYLPVGGMYEVVVAVEKLAKKWGVKLEYGRSVGRVMIDDAGLALGVELESGEKMMADEVVINADLSYTYKQLLGDTAGASKLLKKKYSNSVMGFHWGVKTRCKNLATHNLFFSGDYRLGFEQVLKQSQPPDRPHFYVQAPSRTDASRAPEGEDTLSVMIPINHIRNGELVDWKAYRDKVREYVIARMAEAGVKVKGKIKFEVSFTPEDWRDYLNLSWGSVYGLDHNLGQLGYLRPGRQHKKYKNVWFVGASNHPGSGLPTVLLSAEYTAERVGWGR